MKKYWWMLVIIILLIIIPIAFVWTRIPLVKFRVQNKIPNNNLTVSTILGNIFIYSQGYKPNIKEVDVIFTSEEQNSAALYLDSTIGATTSMGATKENGVITISEQYTEEALKSALQNSEYIEGYKINLDQDLYTYLCMVLDPSSEAGNECLQKSTEYIKNIEKYHLGKFVKPKIKLSLKLVSEVYAQCSGTIPCGKTVTDPRCANMQSCSPIGFRCLSDGSICQLRTWCDTSQNTLNCSALTTEYKCNNLDNCLSCATRCNVACDNGNYCTWGGGGGEYCGNGKCEAGESCGSCPADCPCGGGINCTIQGMKVPDTEPPRSQTVSIPSLSWSTTSNPFSKTFSSSGGSKLYDVSVTVPAGYSVSYTVCYNDNNCHGGVPVPGNTVTLDTANFCNSSSGWADLWFHFTSGGEIRGRKGIVSTQPGGGNDYYEEVSPIVSQPVLLFYDAISSTSNPFSFPNLVLNAGDVRTLSSQKLYEYEVGSTLCYGNYNCHANPAQITPGFSLTVEDSQIMANLDPNDYASAWFHYTPLPGCTITGPSSIAEGSSGTYSTVSTIQKESGVVVNNNVKLYISAKNGGLPKSIGNRDATNPILGSASCGDNTSCSISGATIDTTARGLVAGDQVLVYCRAANGTLTDPPDPSNPMPPSRLHECNPFCVTGSEPCISGETNATYRAHPFDYNCNAWGGGSDYKTVSVVAPAWWQSMHANVTALGDVKSLISSTASRKYLINNNTSVYPDDTGTCPTTPQGYRYPGVASYGSTINLGSGTLNSNPCKQWRTSSGSAISVPPISYFDKKIPDDVRTAMEGSNKISDDTLISSELIAIGNGSGTTVRGFDVYYYSGTNDLNIGQTGDGNTFNISNNVKVIIYAPNAGVNINDPIHFNDGRAFFMVIAGGDINVDPTDVGGAPDTSPDLEGVYFTEGTFNSNYGINQLHVRGQVIANSFSLARNAAASSPSELFEDDPAQILMFPAFFSLRTYTRQEVAP